MTILFVAPYFGPVHSSGRLWVKALRKLGHEVTVFDYRQAVIPERIYSKIRGGRRVQRLLMQFKLLQIATRRRYDLIFVLKGETIYPQTLCRIREHNKGLLINWMGDDPMNFPNIRASLGFYDIFFTIDRGWVQKVQALGYRAEHLPYGCDPEVHKKVSLSPMERKEFEADLCYVGRLDDRGTMLGKLAINSYRMKVWGYGWERTPVQSLRPYVVGSALDETGMVKAFNAARTVLNLQPTQLITGVNFKTHEIAGCGAFQLTDFKPELPEMYEPGKEIVYFRSFEELKELIDRYLRDERERRRIAEAAQKRAYSEHTLDHRAKRLIEILREL
ncbi:Spore protein YkvP [bacterium HR17]|uniref:Spore protein YkvP n=1 Tax=Candidatus Fervidibacter japonicus TaxID=2035412 RepID=A0A2H5XFC9_9BACT|nr:Spore protein YkvP [bacterium HR17]